MRTIGIQHRVKRTAEGEARPTQVAIVADGAAILLDLDTEQDELDFVLGVFPTSFRAPKEGEDISSLRPHQVKWKAVKTDDHPQMHESQWRTTKSDHERVISVPATYDGLKNGDSVAMVLGGSGDYLAAALARQGENIGAKVYRIPAFKLKVAREEREADKMDDRSLLAELLSTAPGDFYEIAARDRALIGATECWRALQESMRERIACEQRLRQRYIGAIFTSPNGLYPEGALEKAFDEAKASSTILKTLQAEEAKCGRDLEAALEALDVYVKIFKPIEGMGPRIAARIISAVGDIRRFETPAKLAAFLGVHLLKDFTFPRQRSGQVANWHGDGRQALYLSSDQWNKRPDSFWGKYLRRMKAGFRERHPTVEIVETKNGKKKRYTDGHIHKMACWRTMTRFVRRLWKDWSALESATIPEREYDRVRGPLRHLKTRNVGKNAA